MSGSAVVTVNALPVAQNITGSGSYCSGGTGVEVLMGGSQESVEYTLLRGGIPVPGGTFTGDGFGYSFGDQIAGVYTVTARTPSTTCTNTMSGNATITMDPLPTLYVLTSANGGMYCAGGTGVHVNLSGSSAGTTYQLYNHLGNAGVAVAGTGAAIDFGLETAVSTYSVMATITATGCMRNMSGNPAVDTFPLPAKFTVGGGGNYCLGGTGSSVTLSNSQSGVNYQLYQGSTMVGVPVGGTDLALTFPLSTAVGTYSVSATNATTGCFSHMNGSTSINTTALPTAYNVTGTGSYCLNGGGIALGLDGSELNFQYDLYRGATLVATATGTGNPLTFAAQTTAATYTVLATNNGTSCKNVMSGTGVISINQLPQQFAMTGGGAYCADGTGVLVGLASSTTGISYQLYANGVAAGSAVTGTGTGISFGPQTTGGTYSVTATNVGTGCTNGMSTVATVTVNPMPIVYNVTGGGGYCQGGTGMNVSLSGSELGLTYQLFLNGVATGTPAVGTGTALNFGLRTLGGTYTVVANNGSTSCSKAMGGSAVIVVNPLPVVFSMTGGGSYCAGGTGVNIGLTSSTTGVDYQLYQGAVATGDPVAGTGAAIEFGPIGAEGTFTVLATDATSGCSRKMNGTAAVVINPLPVVHPISGGGSYCAGGTGVAVGMGSSEFGISYQLYIDGIATGSPKTGTGAALDFGLKTAAGTYTVKATNPATACTKDMSGTATITINTLPTVYAITGTGSYCAGGAGVTLGLSGSATNTSYQLYNSSGAAGGAVAGTGAAITFGPQMAAGTYTAVATAGTSGCKSNMSGTATVTVDALPTVYNVTGGGSFCTGATGVAVGLSNSTVGISYQLYNSGGTVGGLVSGTGTALNFGIQAAGTYSVTATNVPTGCVSNMSGNATIIENALPAVFNVTGGGQYCAGGAGSAIQLDGSQTGVNYQLYNGSATVGGTRPGATGLPIDFGAQLAAGTYSISAVHASTGCRSDMDGSATITINPLPAMYNVLGGGSYCAGGAGVSITLSGSTSGVTYRLYSTSGLVAPLAGTGSGLSFNSLTTVGTYTVTATDGNSCVRNMNGNPVVSQNAQPGVFAVTSSGSSYCAGDPAGITIGLAASENGIKYQLYNGSAATGPLVSGNIGGTAITFGPQLAQGSYSVAAINTITGCRSDMTGSASITILPAPNVYTIVGGGSYCEGTAGVNISLSGSESTVNYGLLESNILVAIEPGTGGVVDFDNRLEGTYTIVGMRGTCNSNMNGIATVVKNALPAVHTVTGGGNYCSGGTGMHIGLSGSNTGISYQLYYGSAPSGAAVAGTNGPIDFGVRLAQGTYSVMATNATTTCKSDMNSFAAINVSTTPVVYNVTGGGSYCSDAAGVSVGLDGSDPGVSYQLRKGLANVGLPQVSGGGALDFGVQPAGAYSIIADNGCTSAMSGTVTVTMNMVPGTFNVTGGGNYCVGGSNVNLSGSATGISYQLVNGNGTVGSPLAGTGNALAFGPQTAYSTYSVVATNNTSGCTRTMSGSVNIGPNPIPVAYTVNGGGSYCAGTNGVNVSIGASQAGVSYRLYRNGNPIGTAIIGTGIGGVDFGPQIAGTYTIIATNSSNCTNSMNGAVTVIENALPATFNIGSSASSYCADGSGVAITLAGSQTGVSYQLYVGGAPVSSPLTGTGAALNYGMQTAPGLYTVTATSIATSCSVNMTTPVLIGINPLPLPVAVTGGGSYCAGDTGVHIGLAGSTAGIRYELFYGSAVQATRTGTGGALDFGLVTTAGTYVVLATNLSTNCASNMPGTAVVSVNTLPTVFVMGGGGSICQGATGLPISLSGSQSGTNYQYQLYNGGLPTGTPMAGTGNALNFGLRTGAGAYTVVATNTATGCKSATTTSASIIVNQPPVVYTVTGGGGYCAGTTGVQVGLSNSATGVNYQLKMGSTNIGSPVSGTGSAFNFSAPVTAGTYKVVATNSATCTSDMSGTAVVTENARPTVFNVTGGGSYCSGTPAPHVGLNGSTAGIQYQLYRGTSTVGAPVTATGTSIDFGAQAVPGTYRVFATNPGTGCNADMNLDATVFMNNTVTPSVTIVTSPNDTVCAGTTVFYQALASNGGSSPAFAWTINGTVSVSVTNSYNYVPSNGDVVSVEMISNATCATSAAVSDAVTMNVKANVMPAVSVTTNTGDTICRGTVVTYTASPVSGGSAPTYAWLRNGGIPVGTGPTLSFAPSATDNIHVVMTSTADCRLANTVFSAPVTKVVEDPTAPTVDIAVTPGTTVAQGTRVTMTATVINGGQIPSYQWLINGNPVPLANQPVFSNSNYSDGDSVTVIVTSNGVCGSLSAFNSVIMHIGDGLAVSSVKGSGSDLHLLPNPNKGDFTVKGTLGVTTSEEVSLEVTNMLGQTVYKNTVMSKAGVVDASIHLDNVANGMYMLILRTTTENKVFHVVIGQ
jgi:hypothetical protein